LHVQQEQNDVVVINVCLILMLSSSFCQFSDTVVFTDSSQCVNLYHRPRLCHCQIYVSSCCGHTWNI